MAAAADKHSAIYIFSIELIFIRCFDDSHTRSHTKLRAILVSRRRKRQATAEKGTQSGREGDGGACNSLVRRNLLNFFNKQERTSAQRSQRTALAAHYFQLMNNLTSTY